MSRSVPGFFLLIMAFVLSSSIAFAQKGHVLTIRTTDSAGLYLYVGGMLKNKTPQKEVRIPGLRKSFVDVEVAPLADETAAVRTRITLAGAPAKGKAAGYYAVTYELVRAGGGSYELRIAERKPVLKIKTATGSMKVTEGASEEPAPPPPPRRQN